MSTKSIYLRGPDGAVLRVVPRRNVVARRTDEGTWSETTLEPRVMGVLVALASAAGEVVSRSQLLETVWGDTVVNEEVLTRAVSQIRQAVGGEASGPQVVETVRGTGYRWVAPSAEPPDGLESSSLDVAAEGADRRVLQL
jgi:DNA-binding winged helix-turn-helix (wHTH) protein